MSRHVKSEALGSVSSNVTSDNEKCRIHRLATNSELLITVMIIMLRSEVCLTSACNCWKFKGNILGQLHAFN